MGFEKPAPPVNISPMNKLIRKILAEVHRGMRAAMVPARGRPYALPAQPAFPLDAGSLRRDAEKIVRDLNTQFRK